MSGGFTGAGSIRHAVHGRAVNMNHAHMRTNELLLFWLHGLDPYTVDTVQAKQRLKPEHQRVLRRYEVGSTSPVTVSVPGRDIVALDR